MKTHLLFISIFICWCCAAVSAETHEVVAIPSYVNDLGFNREIIFQTPQGCVAAKELDGWPEVSVKNGMRFPHKLAHTGFVGHVRGVVAFKSDGTVALVAASYGNSQLLSEAADEYVRGLSFSAPKRHGQAVAVVLGFECFVTEQGTYGPIFEGAGIRPNQPPEPTVMSVTPRADARVAPATTVAVMRRV